jgi:2-methylisocitrate lyase-like PEP mutase family enzyme
MKTQAEKGAMFRALHERASAFVIPNPWDVGSARLLELLGFEALATTSAGFAFSVGKTDNTIGREQMLAHCAALAAATDLPVSADLGNGFGDTPEIVAETVRLAAAAGLAGCSIEDNCYRDDAPIYPFSLAVERIQAAVEAVRQLDFPFTLTARAENYLVARNDLDDTIKRLQAYQEAGADVLYAPGLPTKNDIVTIIAALNRPINVLMGAQGATTVAELSALGVKRISVGSALSRAAYGAFLRAAREMKEQGTFTFANEAIGFGELSAMFADRG